MSNDRNFIIGNVFTKFKNAFEGLDYYTNLKQVENANTLTLTAYLTTEEKTWLNIKDLIQTGDDPKATLTLLENIELFAFIFTVIDFQQAERNITAKGNYYYDAPWTATVLMLKESDVKVKMRPYYCIITNKNSIFFFSRCLIIVKSASIKNMLYNMLELRGLNE